MSNQYNAANHGLNWGSLVVKWVFHIPTIALSLWVLSLGLPQSAFGGLVHRFIEQTQSLNQEAESLFLESMKNQQPENLAKFRQRAESGRQMIDSDLGPRFPLALSEALEQFDSPSGAYLQQLKDEVKADIALVRGTSDEKDTPLVDQGTINLEQADERLRPIIQMYLRTGQTVPVENLLKLLQAYTSLSLNYLFFTHVLYTSNNPEPNLPWEAYMRSYSDVEYALGVTRTFFPSLPDYSFGQMSHAPTEKRLIQPFLDTFVSGTGKLGAGVQTEVTNTLRSFGRAIAHLEYYRMVFFPRQAADGMLRHLAITMYSTPGAADCIPLAYGNSVMGGGASCYRPSAFRKGLDRYLNYYSKIADAGAVELLQGEIAKYLRGQFGDEPDRAWEMLEASIKNLGSSNAAPQLKEKWPKVTEILFQDQRLRKMLEAKASGLAIFRFLKPILLSQGVGVREEMNRLVEAGFYTDFTPNVEAMHVLKRGFQHNVVAPLMERSRLKDDPQVTARLEAKVAHFQKVTNGASLSFSETEHLKEDAVLEQMESKLTQFTAVDPWCAFFNDTTKTEEMKKQESPWVLRATGVALGENEKPTSTNGSNGIQQILPYFKASFSNAYTSQNPVNPEKMFAAIAVKTSLGLIIPNVVQARMLMADFLGEEKASLLASDYGIDDDGDGPKGTQDNPFHIANEARDSLMEIADREYHFYGESVLVRLSRESFKSMIHRYGTRKFLEKLESEHITDPDEVAKRADQYEETFSYSRERNRFAKQFRQEMKGAAVVLRKWTNRIKDLKKYGFTTGSPSVIDDLFPEKSEDERREIKAYFSRNKNNFLNQSFANWVGILKRTADIGDLPEYKGKEDPKTLRKIYHLAQAAPFSGRELTKDEFTQQFKWHGMMLLAGGTSVYNDLMGYPGGDKVFKPGALMRIYELASDNYHRRLEYEEYARDLLLFRFPALKLDDAYLTYNGSDQEYEKVMTAYLENGIREANKWQRLGATNYVDKGKEFFRPIGEDLRQARKIINEVIPNLPLLDVILRVFPDQKAFVCSEQMNRQLSEESYSRWMNGGRAFGGSVAIVGSIGVFVAVPFAPAAVVIGAGALAVTAMASSYRAWVRSYEVDAARRWENAASAQMGFGSEATNLDYIRQMQKRYDEAWFVAALDIAAAAASTASVMPSLGRFAVTVGRGAWAAGPMGSTRFLLRLPGRFYFSAANLANRAAQPLIRGGVLAEQSAPFLMRLSTTVASPIGDVASAAEMGTFALNEYSNVLLSWASLRVASTGRGIAAGLAFDAATLTPLGFYIYAGIQENATAAAMERIQQNREINADLIQLVNGGYIRRSELQGIMETDANLIEELTIGVTEAIAKAKKVVEANGKNPQAGSDFVSMLRQYEPKLAAYLRAMEDKNDVNNERYLVLKRRHNEAQKLIRGLKRRGL